MLVMLSLRTPIARTKLRARHIPATATMEGLFSSSFGSPESFFEAS
ncbi:hypothetical protein ACPOL_7206 (plasmid) [Acidisarcina polymorpha]|uniref:Uncharacterized protein n=1 Tax=Acidisarcina polymorpha TaxID=2211140 RepID=A0A2Z5GCT9_9BACT|nr:hypothetical protein ACPOL_7206 [Acidisarcina polymorpha]